MKIVFISSVIAFFSLKNAILTLIILIWNNGQNGIFLPHLMALFWENMHSIFSPGSNGCINKYPYIHENGLKQKSAMKFFFCWNSDSFFHCVASIWRHDDWKTWYHSQFEFLNKNVSAFLFQNSSQPISTSFYRMILLQFLCMGELGKSVDSLYEIFSFLEHLFTFLPIFNKQLMIREV